MIGWLTGTLVASLFRPRETFRMVLGLRLSDLDLWSLAVIIICVATILNQALVMLSGNSNEPMNPFDAIPPLVSALLQLVAVPVSAGITLGVARIFGGVGTFHQTLRLIVWSNSVLVCLSAAMALLALVLPVLVFPLAMAALVWSVLASVLGLAEIHRFKSPLRVFLVMLGLSFSLSILLVALMSATGNLSVGPA